VTSCRKSPGTKRGVCIGAMDRLITLKSRAIQAPVGGSVDYSEDFDFLGTAWSNILSLKKGPIFFDGTNVAKQATHLFQIRYRDDVASEIWVELDGNNFDVLRVEDLEERHQFLYLWSVKRGPASTEVNQV